MKTKFLLFILLICIQKLNAQLCFNPFASYAIDVNPTSVCTADFNGDGNIDLATANLSGTVSILLGNGSGTFIVDTSISVGFLSRSICTADFNNDGNADLATTNTGPGTVSIILGNGAGNFTASGGFSTGIFNNASRIASADINNDNKPDLIISTGFNYVLVALGNGIGGFLGASQITVNNNTHALLITDINDDGKADLAVSTYVASYNISVLIGNGIGGFSAASNYAVDDAPEAIVSGDFNGDTILDLATANKVNNVTGDISVLLGTGAGNFAAAVSYGVGTTTVPFSICSADFDGDGNLDLATATIAGNISPNVSILTGNGAGAFGQPTNFDVDSFPNSIVAADFNHDGKMDLAVAASKTNIDTGKVSVLINCNTTGTNQFSLQSNQVNLYPNPASEYVEVESTGSEKLQIEIYSSIGEKVLSKVIHQQGKICVQTLPCGMYEVKIISTDKSYTAKKLQVTR